MEEEEENFVVVFGQDLPHCDDHCYEEMGWEKWRCINPDHDSREECSEDFLHCKVCFDPIDNPDGNVKFCNKHLEKEK